MSRRTKLALAVMLAIAMVVVAVIVVRSRRPPIAPKEHVPPSWQLARTAPMHEAHVLRAKIACAECHGVGFEQKPDETACAKCHAAPAAAAHRGNDKTPTSCTTCHTFAGGKRDATCAECHGANAALALPRHASKEVACGACHDVHAARVTVEGGKSMTASSARSVLVDCTSCHTGTRARHGRIDTAPGPGVDAGEPFDAAVARFAEDAGAARALRDGGNTPNGIVCSGCHAPHTPAVAARDACASCHVSRPDGGILAQRQHAPLTNGATAASFFATGFAPAIDVRGSKVASHDACVTCHEPHRSDKNDVKRCEGCHGDHRAAIGVAAHEACTNCHAPHAPAEARSSCANTGCHAGKTALGVPRVAAHAACASCHNPHDQKASPALACVRCHEDVTPKHPAFASKTAGASTCIGCHAAHPATAAATIGAKAAACSSCHAKAKSDRALHAGGVACAQCHAPHEFGSQTKGKTLCAQCHAAETALVAARPGHAACASCHGSAHSPNKKPACATCHAKETSTALRGHTVCTQCHDAHSGSLGTHATCTSCHAEKAKQQHASTAGGCASCHAPHAGADNKPRVLTPPSCTSCHAVSKLAGLHAIAPHAANCASCHSSHAPPRSDRATCTSSCHVARRDHQPEAKLCKGCHMFRN